MQNLPVSWNSCCSQLYCFRVTAERVLREREKFQEEEQQLMVKKPDLHLRALRKITRTFSMVHKGFQRKWIMILIKAHLVLSLSFAVILALLCYSYHNIKEFNILIVSSWIFDCYFTITSGKRLSYTWHKLHLKMETDFYRQLY